MLKVYEKYETSNLLVHPMANGMVPIARIAEASVKSWQLSLAACAVTPFLVFAGHRLGKDSF